jgi:hypothetical protein
MVPPEVVRLSHSLGHGVGVPAGGHDRVPGGQCGLGEIDAPATAGTGHEPNLLGGFFLYYPRQRQLAAALAALIETLRL